MRRAADGSPRIHIAVWSTPTEFIDILRKALPGYTETDPISAIYEDALYTLLEETQIVWCQVLEDRPEIIVRRDIGTSLEWFTGKRVLILGCGALGSWVAEMLARLNLLALHILDNAKV